MTLKSMKFEFRSLGPITNATLELGDFTIISGRNNTGKTFIAYALYGFMKKFNSVMLSNSMDEFFDRIFQDAVSMSAGELGAQVIRDGHIGWATDASDLAEQQLRLIQFVSHEFSKSELHKVFAMPSAAFENASIVADFKIGFRDDVNVFSELSEGKELHLSYGGNNVSLELAESSLESEEETEDDFEEWIEITDEDVNRLYSYLLARGIFESQFIPVIFSSARHTIPLFINELDYVRGQWVRSLMERRREDRSDDSPKSRRPPEDISNYALPIHDNIDFFRRIPHRAEWINIKPRKDFSADVEKMLGGRFSSEKGKLRFTASGQDQPSFDIPLFLASSSAWEMSSLYFFLEYFTYENRRHFLIIDEPESHLDTANQIQLARLLARLVNTGIKVLITTHSDYIVKEINNLIMLSSDLEDKEQISREFGYRDGDFLNPHMVKAYIAEKGTLNLHEPDDFGLNMPVFDDTINSINRASIKLATRIAHKQEEKMENED